VGKNIAQLLTRQATPSGTIALSPQRTLNQTTSHPTLEEVRMSNYYSFRAILIGLTLVVSGCIIYAQDMPAEKTGGHQPDHIMVVPANFAWTDGPASLPKGTKAAVIEGDPSKPGPFTMRLKLPANYKIPPHWHPGVEHVTVLSGSFYMGLGDVYDESKARKLPVGGFAMMAIGTRHFALTKEESVLQLHGVGPWGITYVNPADDPRNKPADQ
jgi:quercetin dioxygenase-like cupin family protein